MNVNVVWFLMTFMVVGFVFNQPIPSLDSTASSSSHSEPTKKVSKRWIGPLSVGLTALAQALAAGQFLEMPTTTLKHYQKDPDLQSSTLLKNIEPLATLMYLP